MESFASVIIPNRFPLSETPVGGSPARAETPTGAISLAWNPASSIAARTLVLAAENRLEKINDAILICSPPALYKTADALTPEEIETLVNDHIKGWFFLVRELVLYFRRLGTGSLSLIAPEISPSNSKTQVDLLGPSASASFRAFAQSTIASSPGEPFLTMGFTTTEAGDEGDFAAWFFKIIDEGAVRNSCRWHKYSKLKLFR